jgi:hypothetical protein
VTPPARCWYCSDDIRATERSRTVADLGVVVHAACFDQLYETDGPRPWLSERRPHDPDDERSTPPS